jgi:hypothetical protein
MNSHLRHLSIVLEFILQRSKAFGDFLAFILLFLVGLGGSGTVDIIDCSSLSACE